MFTGLCFTFNDALTMVNIVISIRHGLTNFKCLYEAPCSAQSAQMHLSYLRKGEMALPRGGYLAFGQFVRLFIQ